MAFGEQGRDGCRAAPTSASHGLRLDLDAPGLVGPRAAVGSKHDEFKLCMMAGLESTRGHHEQLKQELLDRIPSSSGEQRQLVKALMLRSCKVLCELQKDVSYLIDESRFMGIPGDTRSRAARIRGATGN